MNSALLSSDKQNWETPSLFFDELNKQYHFTFDLAASNDNHKCDSYFTSRDDSLKQKWHDIDGNLFLNPPYGRDLRKWVEKSYCESRLKREGAIVLLIPARTDTSYWHDYIFGKAEIKFLRGRLKFEVDGVSGDPAPFPSALVIYRGACRK